MSFRWGIIGCGLIAPKFVRSLEKTGEGQVVAAASKSVRRAQRFQQATGVPSVYSSYEEMLDREKLDAVYIATSHNFHAENAKLCLSRGLPVLVEKSFTCNAKEAAEVISLARKKHLFCMEAMWTRFNPAVIRMSELLDHGVIGDPVQLQADFCVAMKLFSPKMMPWNRMYSSRLAGGALLDLGVYTVAFARLVFRQPPRRIHSSAQISWTGVDTESEYRFGYADGRRAMLRASFREERPRDAVITGTRGTLRVPDFMHPSQVILTRNGSAPETITIEPERLDNGTTGFQHEIREVHRCLREGRTESSRMMLNETLEIMRTMDALRSQWGMKYPGE